MNSLKEILENWETIKVLIINSNISYPLDVVEQIDLAQYLGTLKPDEPEEGGKRRRKTNKKRKNKRRKTNKRIKKKK